MILHSKNCVAAAVGLLILANLYAPGAAHAQPAQLAPTRSPGLDALERGLALLRSQRWIEALPHLEESVRLEPAPLGFYNLALACRGAGRPACAVNAFERYLASPEANAQSARLAAIRTELEGLRRSIARVRVNVDAPNATIRIDGRATEMTAGEVRVDPGTHVIEIFAPTRESQRRELTLQAGTVMVLDVLLHPTLQRLPDAIVAPARVAPQAPEPTGQLVVEPSVAAAAVSVDGAPRASGPATVSLPVGPHRIDVQASGYQPWSRTVQIVAGGSVRLPVTLVSTSGRGWILPTAIVGGAAVLTAVIVGVAFAARGVADPTPGGWDTVREP